MQEGTQSRLCGCDGLEAMRKQQGTTLDSTIHSSVPSVGFQSHLSVPMKQPKTLSAEVHTVVR